MSREMTLDGEEKYGIVRLFEDIRRRMAATGKQNPRRVSRTGSGAKNERRK